MVSGGKGERPPWKAMAAEGGDVPPQRPAITPPPRGSMDTLFNGGLSPGPMTLVSSFFADGSCDDFKSFSQLLAGAMASPLAAPESTGHLVDSSHAAFFSASHRHQAIQLQSGMIHQQALAIPPSISNSHGSMPSESIEYSHPDEQRLLEPSSSSLIVDKPADDGYNWRKYGQKQVKGSEFPRSYYKCTQAGCPVKKKVERSLNGHITAIIYKGEHSHQRPLPNNKRSKDAMNSNEGSVVQGNVDAESSQATGEHLSGTSDSEEVGDREAELDEKVVEPDPKRRSIEVTHSDPASSHRTVTEPRIIVQTTSEVDLLDDGYRWRKYGQKVVKGNPYPRSYYKCTTQGCNVRKHVERASTDPKAVITTYEGKHNHDVPATKTNSHTIANNSASHLKPQNNAPEMRSFGSRGNGGSEQQQPVARLRLKEERIT